MEKALKQSLSGTTPASTNVEWPSLSPEGREIVRRGAEMVFNLPAEWRKEFEEAGFGGGPMTPAEDSPVIRAASRRTNWAGLQHWASANIQKPGERVPSYVTPDMENIALELARRGQQDVLLNSTRALQNAAWKLCMKVGFLLTQDAALLKETFEVCFLSISDFVDGNYRILSSLVSSASESLLRDSHVEKAELVNRILDGTEVTASHASARLGYELKQMHYGALIWSEIENTQLSTLDEAARVFARSASAPAPLIVVVGSATLWVWCAASKPVDRRFLDSTVKKLPGVRIAMGSACKYMGGFRRTHLEAATAQRVLGRLNSSAQVVSIDQVRLVDLLTQDSKAARHFVNQTLGNLAQADPTLLKALRVFLIRGSNVSEAARVLHTHRNTLLRRIARAEELLPQALADSRLNVAAALELLSWMSDLEQDI
ncbi:PucR family transcriptional regulator [Pseudomonas nitroreducens]|uniref:PucR family transcriptional regulator n=1 Tax=Pseudomonas nitroreducens TaxID=46680 RepID=A0A6G6ISS8_PSENT|nr:helix-turn-helix domain-containing protein [Pseudomonas nitroreducens]QIE86109.1 PucR family transcriptional regulator [Pseudomonas nitroreducens]